MTNTSTNLRMPYLAEGQAQKHVSVNEAVRRLDAIVQLSVESASVGAEPGAPEDGQCWVVPAGKSGANWSEFADQAIAYFRDGAWEEIDPRQGWCVWVRDSSTMLVFDGAAWADAPWMPIAGGVWGNDASHTVVASASGYPATIYRRAGDAGRSLAMGFDGANRQLFVNRWDYTTDAYIENLLFIGQGGAVDFVGAAPPRIGGAAIYHGGASAIPAADNVHALGDATYRFSTVYAATGAINTSDAREKTEMRTLTDAEARAVQRIIKGIGLFKWVDAVVEKGTDGARLHCGVTAQAVREAFEAEGLDARRYALYCEDPLPHAGEDEAQTRFGVRYDQLFALILAALSERSECVGQPAELA